MTKSFPEGTSLLDVYQEFADDIKLPYPVVSAKVNNASQGLKFRLRAPCLCALSLLCAIQGYTRSFPGFQALHRAHHLTRLLL